MAAAGGGGGWAMLRARAWARDRLLLARWLRIPSLISHRSLAATRSSGGRLVGRDELVPNAGLALERQ